MMCDDLFINTTTRATTKPVNKIFNHTCILIFIMHTSYIPKQILYVKEEPKKQKKTISFTYYCCCCYCCCCQSSTVLLTMNCQYMLLKLCNIFPMLLLWQQYHTQCQLTMKATNTRKWHGKVLQKPPTVGEDLTKLRG